MSHHIAHAVPDYITHELAILRLWCGIYRQPPEEFVRRYGARFEERHGQLPRTRCGGRIESPFSLPWKDPDVGRAS